MSDTDTDTDTNISPSHYMDWEHHWIVGSKSYVRLMLSFAADGTPVLHDVMRVSPVGGNTSTLPKSMVDDVRESFDQHVGMDYPFREEAKEL